MMTADEQESFIRKTFALFTLQILVQLLVSHINVYYDSATLLVIAFILQAATACYAWGKKNSKDAVPAGIAIPCWLVQTIFVAYLVVNLRC